MYLDNASAGIMSDDVLNSMISYYRFEQKHGAKAAAKVYGTQIKEFYLNVRELLNANSSEEIAFLDSSSRAINLVVNTNNIKKSDKIITLSSEFGTTLLSLIQCTNQSGAELIVLPCQLDGSFSVELLEEYLQKGANWIIISHVTAQGAIINPVEEVGKLAKKYNAIYVVDGCQAVGQINVDVKNIGCDIYWSSGRKWLCGPRGTGFIYVKSTCKLKSCQLDVASANLLCLGKNKYDIEIKNTAKRFELWERSIANMIGLSTAILQFNNSPKLSIANDILERSSEIIRSVEQNKKFVLVGKNNLPLGTVGFYTKDTDSEEKLRSFFEASDIQISYLKTWECPLFISNRQFKYIFRMAPHYYTAPSDIHDACIKISTF